MRKKTLAAGLAMAMMLTVSACGSKNTTAETTAAVTTAAETTTAAGTAEETTDTAGTTAAGITSATEDTDAGAAGGADTSVEGASKAQDDLSADQIKAFAEEIQAAVAGQDIGWLADLAAYPVYVSLEVGEGSDILDKASFLELDKEKLFSEKLMSQIAEVDPEELEVFGAGVIMGQDVNIIFNSVDGEPAITGINL